MSSQKEVYTTAEVAGIVGIDPRTVKNYADVAVYGIEPRKAGEGTGSRKLYSVADIFRIGIAHQLARFGLTPAAIGQALSKIPRTGLGWSEPEWDDAPVLIYAGNTWRLISRSELSKNYELGGGFICALNIWSAIERVYQRWHDYENPEVRQ